MVNPDEPYSVIWTPDFEEDVFLALHYIEHVLNMPHAAQELLASICEKLEAQVATPECAITHQSLQGEKLFTVACGGYNIYYVLEDKCVKAIGLKHQTRRK